MKDSQTVEQAAKEYIENKWPNIDFRLHDYVMPHFTAGAEWATTPSQEGGSAGRWRKASEVKMEEGIQWFYKIPSNGNRGICRYNEDYKVLEYLVYGDWDIFPYDFLDKVFLLDETASIPSPSQLTTQQVGGLSAEEVKIIADKTWEAAEDWIIDYDSTKEYGGKITKPDKKHFINSLLQAYKSQPTGEAGDGWVKPKVVCFCGSTRFAEVFMVERWLLEKQGIITLGINILPNNYFVDGDSHGAEQEGVKHILDELHKRKIDLSDEVVILNVNGYIGESTRAELDYAISIGKPVKYFEPASNQ